MSIRIIVTSIIVFAFTGIVVADGQNELDYKPGELIVRFAPKAKGLQRSKAERNAILSSIKGGTIKHSFKHVPGLTIVKLPEKSKVKDKLKAFKNKHGILYAEPNYKGMIISNFPNDPQLEDLWGIHNTGQVIDTGTETIYGTIDADIDAPEAWDIYTGSQDIIVAVLDSGIDYNHPDLAANMWINELELNGDPNYDDDGNNYNDDIYGYDFADHDSDPNDYLYHGTHVAGIIGALGNNNLGVTGVCWNVKIMNVEI